jgi:serine/threonine protein kinase
MAPEQVTGGPVDSRADIFATGLVLYELLSYRRAFGDKHDAAVHRLLREAPLPLMTLCPDLPVAIPDIVNKALEKDPNRRYQDIGEMRSAIAAVRARLESAAAVSTRVAMPDVITGPRAVPARDRRRASSGPDTTPYSRRLPAVGGALVLTAALSQLWLAHAYEGRLPDLPASPAAPHKSFFLPPPPATPFAAPVPKATRLEREANEHPGPTIRPASSEAQAPSVVLIDTPAPRIAEPAAAFSDRSDAPIEVQARPPLQTTSRLPVTSVGGVRESPSGESASRDIRELLEGRYAGAMTDRRVEAISAIYPAVDQSLLQRQFAAVRSWRVAMSCPVVNVGSGVDSADATCAVTYQTELAARPGQRENSEQTAHVRLTRRLESWSIDRVRFGR